MGCSKSSSKSKIYSNTILPQNTRKIVNKQPNFTDDTTLMAESEEELKGLLMKVKVESEKVGLSQQVQHSENKDHIIWSHLFMANRWGNSGNSVRLYFFGFQNHCRW